MTQQILIRGLWIKIRHYALAKQTGQTEMLQSIPEEKLAEYTHLPNINFANNIRYVDLDSSKKGGMSHVTKTLHWDVKNKMMQSFCFFNLVNTHPKPIQGLLK